MDQGIIRRENLDDLLSAAGEAYRVYGPVAGSAGVALSELGSSEKAKLDFANTKLSAKGLFFPQCEAIYAYEGDELRDVRPPDGKTIVFGMRPCDARALSCLEAVFGTGDVVDPFFRRRREDSLVIALACREPGHACFCTSVGGGPAGKEGADVLAFDLGDALLLEACSEKGQAFMGAYSRFLEEPSEADIKAKDEQATAAEQAMASVASGGLEEKLEQIDESPVWGAIAQRCLGCGVCTYLCPTCHCFTLFDDAAGSCGTKTKNWDSCMFAAFTAEASGHNPRATQGDRMRQRVMHKFRYTVENFGTNFCVGCGRCVTNCPVNVDIRETLTEINR